MKKGFVLRMLAVALFVLSQMAVYAQGVIVYKRDGTQIKIPYTQLDSIATFTYEEGQDDADGNAAEKIFTVNGVSFKMIKVAGGTFTMGSTSGYPDESPLHKVAITKDYYIGETEVTQELWTSVMGSNPSYFTTDSQLPVERVSWNDCQTFITKLNELTGGNFRLPTEAEWEFAARGGTQSKGYTYSGGNTIGDVAWYTSNSSSKTHAVKTKQPNELSIYDMSGNVREWCQDWFENYSSAAVSDPTGPSAGTYRVPRGGSWNETADRCRSASRYYSTPRSASDSFGLRLASQ